MEVLWSALSVLGMLLVMVAIFAGAYWFTKKFGGQYAQYGASGRRIQILDQAATGRDQRLLLVRVADKVYLLSAGGTAVTKLDEYDGMLFPEDSEPQQPQSESFLHVLERAARGLKDTATGGKS